jgi:hypothetical protein
MLTQRAHHCPDYLAESGDQLGINSSRVDWRGPFMTFA